MMLAIRKITREQLHQQSSLILGHSMGCGLCRLVLDYAYKCFASQEKGSLQTNGQLVTTPPEF